MTNDLATLDVFYGDLTVNRAFVYARLPMPTEPGPWSLVGQVRGPRCLLAETLPVNSPLVDLGPGPTLLARATVTDPCFWSPDLPAIYDVTVNLVRGTEVVSTARREIGLRSLGVRGRYLSLDGQRWVLRGVSTHATSARLPRDWHEHHAAFHSDLEELETLAECSEWGALALIFVPTDEKTIAHIRGLAQFPGVAIAVTDAQLPPEFNRSQVAPNLLLGQWLSPQHWMPRQPWADLLLVCADEPELLIKALELGELPVIAARYAQDERKLDLPSARAACDKLQRDLAPIGQFAGYIV